MFMHFEADNVNLHTKILSINIPAAKGCVDIQVNDFIKIHAEVKAIKYLNIHGDLGTYLRIKDGEWVDFDKN